jgi:hypothetical protein
LCEFANVRNRAVHFFARQDIFISLKRTFAKGSSRPGGDSQSIKKRTSNVEVTGAARLYRAASGGP